MRLETVEKLTHERDLAERRTSRPTGSQPYGGFSALKN